MPGGGDPLYGYGPLWTTVVQQVDGYTSYGYHLVSYNGTIYLIGDGQGVTLTISGDPPTLVDAVAFSYSDGLGTHNAMVFENKIWFVVGIGSGDYEIYSWAGSGAPTLEHTVTDGNAASAVLVNDGSDVYVAYGIAGPKIRVRGRNTGGAGSWGIALDSGAASGLAYTLINGTTDGSYWYVVGTYESDVTYVGVLTNNPSTSGEYSLLSLGDSGQTPSMPCVFNGKLYVAAPGYEGGGTNPGLFEIDLTTGVQTTIDVSGSIPNTYGQYEGISLGVYDGSLYWATQWSGEELYKSDGTDTTSWAQVTA